MLPVYFPFTVLGDGLITDIGKFFDKIAVYQVSEGTTPERLKTWCDKDRLDIRSPLQEHDREISALLKSYRIWAEQHRGVDISFFKMYEDNIPFFTETSVSQIRKDIKDLSQSKDAPEKERERDFSREIFLLMAQDFDEKNQDIARELSSQAIRERELMENLKGEELPSLISGAGDRLTSAEETDYMISNRMLAWTHLMLADTWSAPMAITPSRSALDELVERVLQPEDVIHLGSISEPAGGASGAGRQRADLAAYIQKMGALPWVKGEQTPDMNWDGIDCETAVKLRLYLIPGMTTRELFDSYAQSVNAGCRIERNATKEQGNMLLGLIESGSS